MNKKTKITIGILLAVVILVGGIGAWQYGLLNKEGASPPQFPAKIECEVDSDCAPCGSGCAPIEISQKDICHVGLQLNKCICTDNKCVVKEEVTITTDKEEYKMGEDVKVSAHFNRKIYVFSYGNWSIYKQKNNSWVKIAESVDCSSYPSCKEVNFNKIEVCSFPICEAASWYKIDKSHPYAHWVWDQKYYSGDKKSYKCKWGQKTIDHECIVYTQSPIGKYKVRFEYAKNIDEKNLSDREEPAIKYTEEEFEIQ